ncbi:MAG: GntR family transcriptional regulator [Gulosibacter sp.]|uniref:GntR family transcriptional regulator n=1 Tax=Gulosibacter sp. TaxID=2817531 RepID=UPI003F939831
MTTLESAAKFRAISHGAAGANVARQLRLDILAGHFEPGTRIRQTDLAERYGASRAAVRDALRLLAADGLISSIANTGAWISKLSLRECDELYRIREQLEPLLLEFTVPELTDEVINRAEALAQEISETEELEAFLELDRKFHYLTYSGGETLLLSDTVRGLWDRTHHYRRVFMSIGRNSGDRSVDSDHQLIASAIRRRDAAEAGSIMRLHIRRTRLRLTEHPEIFE